VTLSSGGAVKPVSVLVSVAAKSTHAWGVQILALAGVFIALAVLVALSRRPTDLDQNPA
jgi:hypothetical protein